MTTFEIVFWLQQVFIISYLCLVIGFAVRVIMQRLAPGVALAWLLVLVLLPYLGVMLYLLFGERFLGVARVQRRARLNKTYRDALPDLAMPPPVWHGCHSASASLVNLEYHSVRIPVLGANQVAFIQQAQMIVEAMVKDIQQAQEFCHIEFYIWQPGGMTEHVAQALEDASKRGVHCRVMLDAVGSAEFFRSGAARRLRRANIELVKACPIGIMPWRLARYDLRNHRKTVVIDGKVSYIGSFNLVDPALFKVGAGVGQWIDIMARIEGPAAIMIDAVFRWYWQIETGSTLKISLPKPNPILTHSVIQVAPTGPDAAEHSMLNLLLQAIYVAADSVDIVTPYFVPGEALATALKIAAQRGVKVRIILPAKVDSFLVRYASRSYFVDLLDAGAEIFQYPQGLLHSKCIVIDSGLAFFGTVNLDTRSLWLNFELTTIFYDIATAQQLQAIVDSYRQQATPIHLHEWHQRKIPTRFFENTIRLFSPLI